MPEKRNIARALILLALVISLQQVAAGDDFGMIVKNIEKHYEAKKKKIPFLGVANFFVKIIKPAGVKSFKVAVFEDQDFAPGRRDLSFEQSVRKSLNSKWKPMVRSNSRSTGSRAYVYTHQSGKDLEMLTVTFSSRQAIVVQAKVEPDAVARFIDKPEILGFSLAGGSNSMPSIFDPSGATFNAGSSSEDSSLDNLRDPDAPQPGSKSPPVLKVRSAESDSDFNPVSNAASRIESDKSDEAAIKLEARLINMNVKAIDRSGNPLSNLRKEDFRVFEDGVEQDIFYFEPVSAPINLVLLVDLSGSTRDKREVMMETARKFIDSLGPQDSIAIAAFTRDFVVVSDFTSDKKRLKQAVGKMKKIHGGTAFYDGLWKALDLLARVKDSRKAIVVLTDGVDNSLLDSQYEPADHSFDELLSRVAVDDATIYPIYFNPEETRILRDLNAPEISDLRRERLKRKLEPNTIARRQLEMLAEETAGTIFRAEEEKDLDGVYQRVASELRLLYTLAYAPHNDSRDGKYRMIEVRVKREGATLKTRRGYYAR